MTYSTQTWTDWSGAPADAPTESRFTAERGNHMEAGIAAAHDELAGTTTGEPGKLLRLDDSGRATAAEGTDDTHLATVGQAKTFGAVGATLPDHTTLATQPSISSTTLTGSSIPDLQKAGLKTGDKIKLNVLLQYRAASGSGAGGIKVRFKAGATGVTNKLSNPSLATDIDGFTSTGLAELSRDTTLGGPDGSTANLKVVITGSAPSQQVFTEWVPVGSVVNWSGATQGRRVSATARTVRYDLQYKDAADDLITGGGTLGANTTPGTGSWGTRAIVDDTHGAGPSVTPTNATHVRGRIAILNVVAGDEFHFGSFQVEPTAAVPTFGSTGGSGSTALSVRGAWHGLKLAGTSDEDYTKIVSIRTADDPDTTAGFGAIAGEDTILSGTFDIEVLGDGLTDQEIVLEFAQRATSGTATQLVAGSATFSFEEAA